MCMTYLCELMHAQQAGTRADLQSHAAFASFNPAVPARVPHPGRYRVLELTAGLVVISIALTPDLRD